MGSAPYRTEFSHPDPVDLFGHVVVGGLAARGIAIDGGFRRARGVRWGEPVARLATPIVESLVPILRDSNNPVADQLFLRCGAERGGGGTRESGAAATRSALEALGVSAEGLVLVDGSGLSKDNRVRAEQFTALLASVLSGPEACARPFLEALPIAGETGRFGRRMRGTPAAGRVRAKTGWVQGASALSGVLETLDGRSLVFSILVAYPRLDGLNTHAWKPMQDEICVLLVESERP